jgi:serine/threonine-protein kinase
MSESQPTPPLKLTQPVPPPPGPDPLIGQQVGEYVVEAAIAAGGMGIVYRAVHPMIGRRVAIKVVRPEMVSDKEQAERFLKEAQALSAIKHRGIIEIIGFGNLPDGRQYMVMEFLEGEPLESVMAREGPMSPARALPLVDEILSALSAAHKAGVVHRDLKPSNVFISNQTSGDRTVKVLDFGLAKHAPVVFESPAGPVDAKASLMAGTPEYIAPEQARGLAANPQTDLYCVGVMLFEMLSGELPFKADNVVELMKKHVYEEAPRVARRVNGMPESLDALVAVLLEKEAEKRPASADVARQTVLRIMRQLREESTRQAPNPLLTAPTPQRLPDISNLTPELPVAAMGRAPAAITSKLPDRIRTETVAAAQREPDRTPLLLLLLLLLFLGGGGLAIWLYGHRETVAVVIEPPVPTPAPAIVAAPTSAPEADLTPPPMPAPEPAPKPSDPDELAKLPPPKVKPPEHAAEASKVHPEIFKIPENDCLADDEWKRSESSYAARVEGAYREKIQKEGKVPDPKMLDEMQRLRAAINEADSNKKCARAHAAIVNWADVNNR